MACSTTKTNGKITMVPASVLRIQSIFKTKPITVLTKARTIRYLCERPKHETLSLFLIFVRKAIHVVIQRLVELVNALETLACRLVLLQHYSFSQIRPSLSRKKNSTCLIEFLVLNISSTKDSFLFSLSLADVE